MGQLCGRNVKSRHKRPPARRRVRSAADAGAGRHQLRSGCSGATAGPVGARPGRGDPRASASRSSVFSFPPGSQPVHPRRAAPAASCCASESFDLVHAHYGLAGWSARSPAPGRWSSPSTAPTSATRVVGPLSRRLAWRADLVAAVSRALFGARGRPAGPAARARLRGPALRPRPRPLSPAAARRGPARSSASTRTAATCSSPPTPIAPEKRADRAAEVAAASGAELLTGGAIEPDLMPLWVNAANAVLVTSDYEGFGLACVEALACDVPVLSTPVGIAPFALARDRGNRLRSLRCRPPGRRAAAPSGGTRPAGRRRRARGLAVGDANGRADARRLRRRARPPK